jgi:branched-chain amino acid transport system substrate-binding protein
LLKLLSADDAYEPSRTGEAMNQLFEREQVFGLLGDVGTPAATVALPFALEHQMLVFRSIYWGQPALGIPSDHYVFN